MEDFEKSYAAYHAALKKANALNKTALFDALAPLGITTILVQFDGEGDSGQINEVSAFAAETPFELPQTAVTFQDASWDSADLTARDVAIPEAIENLCYGYLELKHGGWEINEGSFGEFTLTVAERSIELDFNTRFYSSENFKETF